MVIECEVPGNMSPSEAGYIIDERLDSYDITALIIYWASKGYLEIIEEELIGFLKNKEVFFVKLKDIDNNAQPYEKYMFKKLFKKADSQARVKLSSLKYEFYYVINETSNKVKQAVKQRNIYEKSSLIFQYISGGIAVLPVLFLFFDIFMKADSAGNEGLIGVAFSIFFILPLAFISYTFACGKGMKITRRIVSIFGGFIPLCVISGLIFSIIDGTHYSDLFVRYCSVMPVFIFSFYFVFKMKKRTKHGNHIYEKLEGFKEFIKTAERDTLERMLDKKTSYFYDILPYAIVFGLTNKWASRFDTLLVPPPDWYRGQQYDKFQASAFSDIINSMSNRINAELSSKSSSGSRSSSSGGSSGGGSGGGGGSSW